LRPVEIVTVVLAVGVALFGVGVGRTAASQRGPLTASVDAALEQQALHDLEAAKFYFSKRKAYAGAKGRLIDIASSYPEFTRIDEVYFLLAECYLKTNEPANARHFFEFMLEERPESAFAERARKRLAELPPGPAKPAPPEPDNSQNP